MGTARNVQPRWPLGEPRRTLDMEYQPECHGGLPEPIAVIVRLIQVRNWRISYCRHVARHGIERKGLAWRVLAGPGLLDAGT